MRSLLIAAIVTAAAPAHAADPAPVIAADRAFSAMSAAKGARTAFDHYVAPTGVFVDRGEVIESRDAVVNSMTDNLAEFRLTWEPAGGAISDDGTLGVTWGRWVRVNTPPGKPSVRSKGAYITGWRKMPDGQWRAIVDGGSPRPLAAEAAAPAPVAPPTR